MRRFCVVVMVLAAITIVTTSCKSLDSPEVAAQESPSVAVATPKVVSTVTAVEAAEAIKAVEAEEEQYKLDLHNDSIADMPLSETEKALGTMKAERAYASEVCSRFARATRFSGWLRDLGTVKVVEAASDEARRHLVANVRAIAKELLSGAGEGSAESSTTFQCGWGRFEVLENISQWMIQGEMLPSSLGFPNDALRKEMGKTLGKEVLADGLIEGGANCVDESGIGQRQEKYKFTQKELGLTSDQWAKFILPCKHIGG